MKVAVEANMINEVETSIFQNWLLPLLKFNWQRMYDTLKTIPASPPWRAGWQPPRESSLRERPGDTLRKVI